LLRCRTWRTLRSAHCAHRCAAILPRCSGVSEPACAGHIAPWAPLVARNKCPTHARAFWHRGEPSAPLSRSLRARGMSPLTVIEFNWASTWLPQPTDRKRTRVERQEAHCVAGAEVGRQTLWLPLAQGRNATIVSAVLVSGGYGPGSISSTSIVWCAAATLAKRVAPCPVPSCVMIQTPNAENPAHCLCPPHRY
jgi:hypothetical protein